MIVAPDEILEAKEVAEVLKVHTRTVMRLAGRGELRGFRIGDLWRFRRSAVEDYIRRQEEQLEKKDR